MLNKILLIGNVTGTPHSTSGRNGARMFCFALEVDDAPAGAPGRELAVQHFLVTAPQPPTETEQGHARLRPGDMVFVEGSVRSGSPQEKTREGGGPMTVIAEELFLLAQSTDHLKRSESGAPGSKGATRPPPTEVGRPHPPQPAGLAHFCAISPEVTREILEILRKGREQPIPTIPFPISPLWVEFESSPVSHGLAPCQAIWTANADAQITLYQILTGTGRVKTLTITTQGIWMLEQKTGCDSPSCALARLPPSNGVFRIDERLAGQSNAPCACAQESHTWMRLISVLGHLLHLREKGIEAVPTPLPILSRNRELLTERVWRELPELYIRLAPTRSTNASNASPASPRRIPAPSISQPERGSAGPSGYYRFLVPGPGKPWVRFRAIYVERGTGDREKQL